jgi:hypothetical protein
MPGALFVFEHTQTNFLRLRTILDSFRKASKIWQGRIGWYRRPLVSSLAKWIVAYFESGLTKGGAELISCLPEIFRVKREIESYHLPFQSFETRTRTDPDRWLRTENEV